MAPPYDILTVGCHLSRWWSRKRLHPPLERIVVGTADAAPLAVAGFVQTEAPSRRRAVVHGNDEHATQCAYVDCDHVRAPTVVELSTPVVGAAAVELDAALADSARFDLDAKHVSIGRNRSQVEREATAERNENLDT
jgi:hypothetical protein